MESTQTRCSATPGDDDLGQATVRELIVQLALVEDEYRKATNPGQIAALARRERTIVVALHRHGLALNGPGISHMSKVSTAVCSADDVADKGCR